MLNITIRQKCKISRKRKILVDEAKYWIGESKTIVINEENSKPLISQIRGAKQKDTGVLDKDKLITKSTTFDAFEYFFYALQYFKRI